VRFVFSVRPYLGHLHPMLPLAASLVRRGHEVCFVTAKEFMDTVQTAGFPAIAAGPDPRQAAPLWVPVTERGVYGTWVTRAKMEDILVLCSRWRPAVLVRDPTDFAGLLAAEAQGLPQTTLGFSQFYPRRTWQQEVGSTLAQLRREFDLPPDPGLGRLHPHLYLDTVPPLFQPPHLDLPAALVSIRPLPPFPADPSPLWSLYGGPPPRPLVYATLGTFFNKNPRLFNVIAQAVASLPVSLLCTVGPDQAPEAILRDPPPNVCAVSYLSQVALHAHCDVVVSHGGFGTVLGALCAGVPVITVPQGSDHPGNARRAQQLGAGLIVNPGDVTPASMRRAILEVLHDPRYAAAARAFADHVRRLPSPDHGARLLSELPALLAAEVDVRAHSDRLLREAA
jgi:UDP:flavonoid glycosyltransferase YjiC (YdhE family)